MALTPTRVRIVPQQSQTQWNQCRALCTAKNVPDSRGYWPDIEKSRAEARRLLKEAGAEALSFELLNRNVDQPYKYYGIWVVDQWSKIGLRVTQRVLPT